MMTCINRIGVGQPGEHTLPGTNRLVGSQISEWSCVAASLEYLSYFVLGRTTPAITQEDIQNCYKWSCEGTGVDRVERVLYPFDGPSTASIFAGMCVRPEKEIIVDANDTQLFCDLEVKYKGAAFLLISDKFRKRDIKHAVAIEKIENGYMRLVIPCKPVVDKQTRAFIRCTIPGWGEFVQSEVSDWESRIIVFRAI